ncbi:hypothetical protein H4R27_005431 [Coemansia aciculifera]|nr:hypothetical protein H4R27_005431 [Coemansia aciculifera]
MRTNDSRSVEGPAPCVGTEMGTKLSEQRAPANDTGDNEVSSPLPTLSELSTLLSSPQHKEFLLPPQHEELLLPLSPLSQPEESSPLPAQPESPPLPALSEEVPASDPAGQRKEKPTADGNKGAKNDKLCTKKSDGKASSKCRTSNSDSDNKAIFMPPASDKQHAEPVSDAAAVVPPVVEASSAADANDVSTSALSANIEQQGELVSDAPTAIPSVTEVNKDSGDNASTTEDPARDKQQVEPVSDVSTVALPVAKVNSVDTDDVPTSVDLANSGQPAEPDFVAFTTVLPDIKTSDVGTNDMSAIAPHASCEQDTEPVSASASTLAHINVNPSHDVVGPATDDADTQYARSRAGDKAKASALNISAEKDSVENTGGSDSSGQKVTPTVSATRSVKLVSSTSAPTPSSSAAEVESKAENKDGAKETSGSGSSTGKADPPAPVAQPEKPVSSTSAPTPSPIAVEASHDVGGLAANDAVALNAAPNAGGMAEAQAQVDKMASANKDSVSGDSNGAVATPTSFAHPEGPVTTASASTPVLVSAKASHSVDSSVAAGTSAQLGTHSANRSDKGKELEGRNLSDAANDDMPTSVEPASSSGGSTSESLNNLGEGSSGENESFRRCTVDYALGSIITEQCDIAEGSARNSDGNSFGASIVIQPLRLVLKSDTAGQGVVLVTDTNDNMQPTVPRNNSVSADGDADMQDTESPKGIDPQTVDADTEMREARPLDTDTEMREVVPLADDDVMQDAELPRGTGALHVVEPPPPADVEMEAVHPPVVELEMEDAEPLHTKADLQAPVLPDYDKGEADVVLPPPEDLLISEAVTKPRILRAKDWMAPAAMSANTPPPDGACSSSGGPVPFNIVGNSGLVLERLKNIILARRAAIAAELTGANLSMLGKRSFDDAFEGGSGNSEPSAKSWRNIKSRRAIASLYSKSTKSGLTNHGA